MKPLIIIPARGGSKGVPGKNIKPLNGKPLINYTVDQARKVFSDDQICVSTDSEEIKAIVEQSGLKVPFLRPDSLATDSAGTNEVLLHALDWYEEKGYKADVVILLQVTSPFRRAEHIKEAMSVFDNDCEIVISVKHTKSNPYYLLREENTEGWLENSKKGNFKRRQDCPDVYEINGAIYIMHASDLRAKGLSGFTRVRKYLMSELDSVDIDTQADWLLADILAKEG